MKLFGEKNPAPKTIATEYYARNIGLTLPGTSYDYEFLVCGKNVPYAQNRVIGTFIEHGAAILTLDGSAKAAGGEFVLSACCNLERADLGPRDLSLVLRDIKFVTSAEYSEIGGRLFGRRISGIAFNSASSAVALRSDSMLKLGRRLAGDCGSSATDALYEEGREYIIEIVEELKGILNAGDSELEQSESVFSSNQEEEDEEAYCVRCRKKRRIQNPRQVILRNKSHAVSGLCAVCSATVFKIGAKVYGKIRGGALVENTVGFLMATGWGAFEIRSDVEGRCGEVTISSPPSEGGNILYGNQFVEGMAAGLLEAAGGIRNRMDLVGQQYDVGKQTLRLRFAEEVPSTREPEVEKRPSRRSLTAAEVEVDRIIGSLEKIESEAMKAAKEQPPEVSSDESPPGPIII